MIRYNSKDLDVREKRKLLSNTYIRFKFDPENDVMEDLIIELAAEVKKYRKMYYAARKTLEEALAEERKERKQEKQQKENNLYFTINNFYGNDE